MGVVTVQLGQCGNQLGSELFHTLAQEATRAPVSLQDFTFQSFFRESCENVSGWRGGAMEVRGEPSCRVARAVLIDMEPKVIEGVMSAAALESRKGSGGGGRGGGGWSYNTQGALCQQSGSGNNWARGYCNYGPRLENKVCDIIRKEVECSDSAEGFLLLQSMAGGTGAGLGTHVAELLRDEYPASFIISHCVWPYDSGEVIVQNYNTLLTLSHMLDAADGIILVPNQALHLTCQKSYQIPRPTFHDLNKVAARALAHVLLPAKGSKEALPTPTCLGEMIQTLCPTPCHRVLTLRSCPQMPSSSLDFTNFTWPALLKRLRQMLISGSILEEGLDWSLSPPAASSSASSSSRTFNKSLAATLTLRGKDCWSADTAGLREQPLYAPWSACPLTLRCNPQPLGGYEKSASLLSNCQTFVPGTSQMLSSAYEMFSSRAYTHQYTQQGMDLEDFNDAFARIEDVIAQYDQL